MIGGAYAYHVPNKYFPDYSLDSLNDYTFSYEFDFVAPQGEKVNYVSIPSSNKATEKDEGSVVNVQELKTNKHPLKDINIYYKASNLKLSPNLLMETNPAYPDEMALAATFTPSFDVVKPLVL